MQIYFRRTDEGEEIKWHISASRGYLLLPDMTVTSLEAGMAVRYKNDFSGKEVQNQDTC